MLSVPLPRALRKTVLPRMPLSAQRRIGIERWLRGREEALRVQRADWVVVSHEKSGRTWLRVMLSRFYGARLRLPEDLLLDYDNFHRIDATAPIAVFTHDRYSPFYAGAVPSMQRVLNVRHGILLVRDPRDVAVSLYFHWRYRLNRHRHPLERMPDLATEPSMLEFVLRPESGLPNIIGFMNRWLSAKRSAPRMAMVRYEDLHADPKRELTAVLRSLGERASASEVANAVEYSTFENMRRREASDKPSDTRLRAADPANPNTFKTRRGKVGGYRDYFSLRELRRIDALVAGTLDPAFGYTCQTDHDERVMFATDSRHDLQPMFS